MGRAEVPERRAVRIRGLTRSFDGRAVLEGFDLDIGQGEFVALLGASGSGKSTLLRALAGLDREAGGSVEVPGQVGVVFQEHRLLPWKRVAANVALGLRGGRVHERALEALDVVGLKPRAQAWPATLSGGEAQRAALARGLVGRPELLLLDEPFAALDALTRLKVQTLVARLWDEHRPAVLLVTHDVDEALLLADRAVVLEAGRAALEVAVNLPRPRATESAAFLKLRRQLLESLGVGPEVRSG